ncbi:MAG: chemotaxis protein CheR [Myxococcota bacterium]|nr:chemotaxis protein CheR [Myxococcota bacterium]
MASGGAQQLSPVCAYVAARTGSSLSAQQVARLTEVLTVRLKDRTEETYLQLLKTPAGAADLAELMSAISVHKTDLFRDEVQLEAFRRHVLTPLVRGASRPLHLWSAGCATGEEVATLLILLHELGAHSQSTVLGTDISDGALRQARTLSFHPAMLRRVPPSLRDRYFQEVRGSFQLIPELSARASFGQHNLMDRPYPSAPNGQGFDVIFCRNVLIYFTEAAFDLVVQGLAETLKPQGTLVLSAAEPILKRQPELTTLKCDQAFFYVRDRGGATGLMPSPRQPPASVLPPVRSRPVSPPRGVRSAPQPVELMPVELDPHVEANQIFELVMDWAAAGEQEAQTEQGLRKCVYLDPHFAQARYLLAMLLEQKGERADAASEYRRALAALNEGRSRNTPFFLNEERLKQACEKSLERLGYRTEKRRPTFGG